MWHLAVDISILSSPILKTNFNFNPSNSRPISRIGRNSIILISKPSFHPLCHTLPSRIPPLSSSSTRKNRGFSSINYAVGRPTFITLSSCVFRNARVARFMDRPRPSSPRDRIIAANHLACPRSGGWRGYPRVYWYELHARHVHSSFERSVGGVEIICLEIEKVDSFELELY